MGQVVKYLHLGSLDGKYPPSESPAIIQSVYITAVSDNPEDDNHEVVDLFVMSNTGGIFFAKKCVLGKNWCWLN